MHGDGAGDLDGLEADPDFRGLLPNFIKSVLQCHPLSLLASSLCTRSRRLARLRVESRGGTTRSGVDSQTTGSHLPQAAEVTGGGEGEAWEVVG